jgi:hypothetical protein
MEAGTKFINASQAHLISITPGKDYAPGRMKIPPGAKKPAAEAAGLMTVCNYAFFTACRIR